MTEERTLYVNWISNALHVSTLDDGTSDNTIHEPAHQSTTVTFYPGKNVTKVNEVIVRNSRGNEQNWQGTASGNN